MNEIVAYGMGAKWRENEERLAIIDGEKSITYKQLENEVAHISAYLVSLGVMCEDKIFVYMERGIEYVTVMFAILKAGACFVPFDKNMKETEIISCFQEIEGRYIFTDDIVIENELCNKVIKYKLAREATINSISFPEIYESSLAYIIFTSGTTGKQKGVMIEYKSLYNLIMALNERVYEYPNKNIRVGVTASFSFDASIKQIFYSLYFAHTLVIIKNEAKYFGRKFIDYLNKYSVEVVDVTPSLLQLIVMDKRRGITHTLQKILIGGEKLTKDTVRKVYGCFGDKIRIFNMYGPTECCVDVAAYEIKEEDMVREDEDLPIGKPLKNVSFSIREIDENGVGILYISGIAVGRGYTNSSDGFFNENGMQVYRSGDLAYVDGKGNYFIIGRKDRQVKLRGFRIELEGIDNCFRELEGVSFSYTVLEQIKGREVLVSFIKSRSNNKSEFISKFREKYPFCIVSNYIIFIDRIKLNTNGKVDYKYYKKIFHEHLGTL